ncbi:MAG: hypothetical protein ACXWEY_10910 [Bacteroidia bacterium]
MSNSIYTIAEKCFELKFSAGTYFMRLDVNGKTKTLKMVVVE